MPPLDPAGALQRLRSTGRELLSLTAGMSAERLQRAPAPEEWAPAKVIYHLADAEMVYAVRIRMVLTADRPYLAGYDEEAWSRRFYELEEDPKETMARWRAVREANIRLFESLEETEWKMTGLHAERGEVSVGRLAATMAEHDTAHLDQIRQGLAE